MKDNFLTYVFSVALATILAVASYQYLGKYIKLGFDKTSNMIANTGK